MHVVKDTIKIDQRSDISLIQTAIKEYIERNERDMSDSDKLELNDTMKGLDKLWYNW